jgi:PAT family beta-lactamase induction signal transducer AmpG
LLSFITPSKYPWAVAACALLITFFSASQDIVFDAYRREVLNDEELGLGSSLGVNGYRVGMLISGAMALILADQIPWHYVYLVLASLFLLMSGITLLAPDPLEKVLPPKNMREAVVQPFIEYFRRHGAIEILVFILLYKIGDIMAANMTTPFYLGMGFTKTQVGAIVKTFGFAATLTGLFVGGLILLRWKMNRCLWLFGILQACSILGFAVLSQVGKNNEVLAGVIALDNFASGMGTSAYVAFMASLTNKRFTATQYALLSSLMGIPRVFVSAPTGYLQALLGWTNFFVFCTLSAIPGLLMLLRYSKWQELQMESSASLR